MGMLSLRDLVFIAPTPSLHQQNQPISSDHHSNLPLPSSASLSVGLGIFPLLAATPCVPHSNEVQDCGNPNNSNYWNLKMCPEMDSARKRGIHVEDEVGKQIVENEENGGELSGGEFRVCQDCGNRAKKDCSYRRCRTCCKGRGYDCNTHVRSTWVPAARRRERQMMVGGGGGYGGSSGVKRPRPLVSSQNAATTTSHSSASNSATPRSLDTSSCHRDASFKQSLPGQVRAPAVFRCHRVSAIGNGEDEYGYLATVHISGHVFKGFLYDEGADAKTGLPSSASELHLGSKGSGKNRDCPSSPIGGLPNNAYPASAS